MGNHSISVVNINFITPAILTFVYLPVSGLLDMVTANSHRFTTSDGVSPIYIAHARLGALMEITKVQYHFRFAYPHMLWKNEVYLFPDENRSK